MSSSLTSEIVEYLTTADFPPPNVMEKAVEHIIDGIAVMLAGSRTKCAKIVADFVKGRSKPQSTPLGFKFKASAPDASLVNGTSGHADDYDDTQLSTSPDRMYGLLTHPTVPVLAATLAVGENVGCTGKDFLKAFATGFEVECKLAEAIKPDHYRRGFHTTATIGAFGSLSATSVLMELNEEEIRNAIGITASLSSGIRANFGTMTKPLHAGMAAQNGINACMLAKKGFEADKNALDGRWGFMNILGNGYDPEFIMGKLGNPHSLVYPGATFKMYPCGSLGQPSMDKLLEIILEENLKPDDVRMIRLRAGPNILEPLRYKEPVNDLQAKFSLQFGLSSILLRRRAGLREYTNFFVNSPEVKETMKKIETIHDPEIAKKGTEKMRSIVEVELEDGRIIKRVADKARGTPEKPLKNHELREKFSECASFVLNKEVTNMVLKKIRRTEDIGDIKELTRLLIPSN